MAIELPELVQRVIIDTKSMREAERRSRELESSYGDLTESLEDNIEATDDNTDARNRNNDANRKGVDGLRRRSRTTDTDTGAQERNTAATNRNKDAHDRSASSRKRDSDSWSDHAHKLISVTQSFELMGKAFSAIKMPVMAGAIPFAVQGLGALGAGAVALTAQLAPLSGLIATLPAGLLAFKTGSMAFKGITGDALSAAKAIEQYGANSEQAQEAMKGLSSEGKNFALGMVDLKGAIKNMNTSMQKIALPAFTSLLGTATKTYMPMFRKGMEGVARGLRDGAKEMNGFLKTKGAQEDFGKIMDSNSRIVGTLVKAAKPLTSVLLDVMVAAGPLVEKLAADFVKLANNLADFMKTARGSGALTRFFDKTYDVVTKLSKAVWDFIMAIYNIASAGNKAIGMDFIGNIQDGAKAFRDWTESEKGLKKINDIFAQAKPILHELWLLLKDVAIGFGLMATESGDFDLAGMIRQIRTDVLPLFFSFMNAAKELIPSIVDLAVVIGGFLNALPFTPMRLLIDALVKIGEALLWVVQTVPGAGWAIAFFLLYKSAKKYLSIAQKIPGIGKAISKIPGLAPKCIPEPDICEGKGGGGKKKRKVGGGVDFELDSDCIPGPDICDDDGGKGKKGEKAVKGRMDRIKDLIGKFGTKLKGAGTTVLAFTTILGTGLRLAIMALIGPLISLGAALLMNPITWIVLAIVALIAVFVLLWVKCKWFRDFWKGLWDKIVMAFKFAWNYIKTGWIAIFNVIKMVFGFIWKIVSTVLRVIWTIISTYLGFVWKFWSTIFKALWKVVSFAFLFVIRIIIYVLKRVWAVIVSILTMIWNVWKTIWGFFWGVIKTVFGFIVGVVSAVLKAVWNVIVTVMTAIFNFWKGIWDFFYGIVSAALGFIVNIVSTVLGFVWNIITTIFTAIFNFLKAIFTAIWNVIKTILTAIWNVIKAIFTTIWNVIKGAFDKVKNTVSSAIGWVREKIESGLNAIKRVWESIWNGVKNFVKGIWDGIKNAVSGAWNWVKDKIANIGEWISNIPVLGGLIKHIVNIGTGKEKALGGPVAAGQAYIVGEKGPELFVPWAPGQIVPNDRLTHSQVGGGAIMATGKAAPAAGGGGTSTVNNYVINIYETTGPTTEESILRVMRRVSAGAT